MGNYGENWLYFGWHLHFVLGGVLLVGAILFIVWAAKTLKPKELLTWAIALMVIGAIGVFLTASTGFRGMKTMMSDVWDKDTQVSAEDNDNGLEDMVKEMDERMGIDQ